MKAKSLVILFITALVGVTFFISCGGDEEMVEGATFKLPGDLKITYGKVAPLKINIPDGLKKVELYYNDSLVQTFPGKKGVQTCNLVAYYYGVGARNAILRSYFADGTQQEESIIIKVVSDKMPIDYKMAIVNTFPHDNTNYTQGLEFSDGQLYEGTGDPGQQGKTLLAKVDLKSGTLGTKIGLDDPKYFGEGITILGNKIYQLTWQNGECFIYDKNTLQLQQKSFRYNGQGWGLCNDGKQLIMSDGSERIYFRDPKTFEILRTIEVYDNVDAVPYLNELEYIDGKIYANIYQSTTVVVIDPNSGKVLEQIDCRDLEIQGKNGGDVLNGIAYNQGKLYMTGKYWTKLFEVKKVPQ